MLNYRSVRSSAPQIRSNPALKHVNTTSGFQKRISSLLEAIALPFQTYQILKEQSQFILESYPHYAWLRPAHLRPSWLILADDMPLMMMDQKDNTRIHSLRIPYDKRHIQRSGILVMEGAWDAQDHILYLWDVVVWEKNVIWNTVPYSERWKYVKQTVGQILDCGHPMSDAEVRVPNWQSLETILSQKELDPAMSIDFQPEKPGQKRHVFLIKDNGVKFKPTTHHERKMVAENQPPKPTTHHERKMVAENQPPKPNTDPEIIIARIYNGKLPDTYRIQSIDGKDLGLAAVRSLELSKQLRIQMKNVESILVDIQWFEPFQKYEIKKINLQT